MIETKIICDSVAPSNVRLTTFVLTYPRFAHSEFLTHRMFSRNASSSRAIPVKKSIQMIMDNPVIPLAFTKNQKGMQGGEALTGDADRLAREVWEHALFHACDKAKMLADLDVHKQYANRLLEPFSHITVVCSATDYHNFFALRSHEAALPEIHELSDKMREAIRYNIPVTMDAGDYHLPFIGEEEVDETWDYVRSKDSVDPSGDVVEILLQRSTAKCARVSYLNHDGTKSTIEQDIELYKRLVGSAPIHASPAEHQAMALSDPGIRSGNFRGWEQHRKTLTNENVTSLNRDYTNDQE